MNWWQREMRYPKPKPFKSDELPFITKTTTKPVTTVDVQVIQSALLEQHDFRFVPPLIARLEKLPADKGVFFPKLQGGLARAQVLVCLDYDDDGKAAATLIFFNQRCDMQMNYYVKITMISTEKGPALRLQMTPNAKLRKAHHSTSEMTAHSNEGAINTIINNFAVGSLFRKIGPYLLLGGRK